MEPLVRKNYMRKMESEIILKSQSHFTLQTCACHMAAAAASVLYRTELSLIFEQQLGKGYQKPKKKFYKSSRFLNSTCPSIYIYD